MIVSLYLCMFSITSWFDKSNHKTVVDYLVLLGYDMFGESFSQHGQLG